MPSAIPYNQREEGAPIIPLKRLRRWVACRLRGVDPREVQRPRVPWRLSRETEALLERVDPFTMNDPLRLATLHGLARELEGSGTEGDIVECGVCRGGSAAVLAAAIRDSARLLWLYDSFEGMPAPGPNDPAAAQAETGRLAVGTAPVRAALRTVRFPEDRLRLRQGSFRETFGGPRPARVALLHIDADWHDSVLGALEAFYPLVSDGGWIVLDDFGHWEGARRAFYAFCRSRRIEPLLERTGYTQAFWRKGRETNRELAGRYHLGLYRPRHR